MTNRGGGYRPPGAPKTAPVVLPSPITQGRKCSVCERVLHPDCFPRDKSKASGRRSYCRECDNDRSRRYYERNRERKLAYFAAYRERNPLPKKTRVCRRCPKPATTNRHHYCDECRAIVRKAKKRGGPWEVRQRELGTARRGYGQEHQRLRKRWAPLVEAGKVRCARCGGVIPPGSPWDLGHDDADRSRYRGPEHRKCNRRTSSHRAEG